MGEDVVVNKALLVCVCVCMCMHTFMCVCVEGRGGYNGTYTTVVKAGKLLELTIKLGAV